MQSIVPPIAIVRKILGSQKFVNEELYRINDHCVCFSQRGDLLLYNTLTGELVLLSREEAEMLESLPNHVPPVFSDLIGEWFLRPIKADDRALADQVRFIASCLLPKSVAMTYYYIFTTMDCNARCFYCYEAGMKRPIMTEDTARSTARYIADHCDGKKVTLVWFGGEPLMNTIAIDIITDFLLNRNVEFSSRIISNGYLFNVPLIDHARDLWLLDKVQITLDGTEENYNRCKAYVHSEGSPYQRVLDNIQHLLDAGIEVNVRLNMDLENEYDLYALCDELAARFSGISSFGVYIKTIRENVGFMPHHTHRTEAEQNRLAQILKNLWSYIIEKGISVKHELIHSLIMNCRKTDGCGGTIVTPEGRLGLCAVDPENGLWGSVYSNISDDKVLHQWKVPVPADFSCNGCALYPQCALHIRPIKCPDNISCNAIIRTQKMEKIHYAVLDAYAEWKMERLH